jgi:hypothetical protein
MRLSGFRVRPWLLAGLIATALAAPVFAGEEKKADEKATSGDEMHEKMMAEMAKYMNPGEQHALLRPLVGRWKAVVKSWSGPGEPQVSEGTSECTWVLGGRWIQDSFKGSFMDQPFEGLGLTGYDLMKKEYVSLWFDTMSTSVMTAKGSYDEAAKTFTYNATYDDPMTGKPSPMRQVLKLVDDKTHVFEMYGMVEGKEAKMMEITYTKM